MAGGSDQSNPANFIPVRLSDGAAFYTASGSTGGGGGIGGVPKGYGQITNLSAATLLSTVSGGIPAGATSAYVMPEVSNLRWTLGIPAPTASVGMELFVGVGIIFTGPAYLTTLTFIQETAGGILNVWFMG